MKTSVSKRGQTVVPADVRRRYRITTGSQLEWIDRGGELYVVPLPVDPISALRGSARGHRLREKLLASRRRDRSLEALPHGRKRP